MKTAIITSFRKMPESYSLVNDVRDQIKTLMKNGHEVVFFGQEGCKGEGIECEMRAVLPHFKMVKNVENTEIKKEMIAILEKELKDFDIAITHDLMYLRGFYTHRKAIMECNLPNIRWLHWSHSGVGDRLQIKMPRSKYIYMNYYDVRRFADSIGVDVNDVRVVFNDKDARIFFNWHPITCSISEQVDLFDRDIMQTYPLCSTRMFSKGIEQVIKVFGKLKVLNNKVLLVVPNSNARKPTVKDEVERMLQIAYGCGLDKKDILFTSTLSPEHERGVPRQVVRDLMQISNLFVFPTLSEVCSNVLLEASMTKQLLVLNKDFPALFDFGEEGRTCLGQHFGSILRSAFRYKTEEEYLKLAKIINQHLLSNKTNQQFLKIKRACNIDTIYNKQLEPILYEQY